MWIFDRWARGAVIRAAAASLAVTTAACNAGPTSCMRFSDCAEGLTCSTGMCVVPPIVMDEAGSSSGTSTQSMADATTGTSSTDSGPTGQSSSDSGLADAGASDSASGITADTAPDGGISTLDDGSASSMSGDATSTTTSDASGAATAEASAD